MAAGHGEWAELRRQLFWTLLHRIQSSPTVHSAAAEMATRATFDLVAQTLDPQVGAAADLHIFGPHLCRCEIIPTTKP